ncbi:MAG: cache domain-containing protein [Nanoarchaeota archaeon]|nr:cache domain-containing protein [Nanoarchaeota archaeon]
MIKDSSLFFMIFVVSVFMVVEFQIYVSVFSSDNDFDNQVENHLISTVQIKGERINDYFLERKHDALVLADSVEVKKLLQGDVGMGVEIIEKNIKNDLDVISKQIEIFVGKYPKLSFSELQEDFEFQNIVSRGLGETGSTFLVDFNSFDKGEFDYYNSASVRTSDEVLLGVAAKVNLNEFKILDNPPVDLTNSMERFREISDYKNLILINPEGYVIYEVDSGSELGTNLNFNAYNKLPLGKAYFEAKDSRSVIVYGPYLGIGETELVLLFLAKVYEGERFLGMIVLQDSMNAVNIISTESAGLGKTGDSYIVDENKFLITSSKMGGADLLIQEVKTENTKRCFAETIGKISYFEDFKGDFVIGTYVNILEVEWCLVAEISEQEVFDTPKQGKIRQDLAVIIILNLALLIFGWIFTRNLTINDTTLSTKKRVEEKKMEGEERVEEENE